MRRDRGAIQILEQAVALLRSAPGPAVLAYLAGAVPFTVGLLFFLVDMTHSPFAFEHLGEASLGVALLYIWKCCWQAVFCARLYRELAPAPESEPGVWRMVTIQAALQPLGTILLLPLPWLVAFFRNLALFAGLGVSDPIRSAGRQAVLWTKQNWAILLCMLLAGVLLFVNVLALLLFLPQLGRSFLGIEGDLARLGAAGLFNVTTLSVAAAITWLAVDPILDAVCVLRCFYGQSIASGEDLRAALRRSTVAAGLAVVAALALFCAVPRAGAQPPEQQQGASLDAGRLDSAIQDVVHRREFTWRSPAAQNANQPEGRWVGWIRGALDTLSQLWDWIEKRIADWLKGQDEPSGAGANSTVTRRQLELLIAIVLAVGAMAAGLFFLRRKRGPVVEAQAVTVAAPAVNLADESLTADQLPEDSWWKLAQDLRAKGEYRLALRALYLAEINHLAGRGLVSIRRWKTGLEYRRELDRRARAIPELAPLFARGVALFEQGWYGRHPVEPDAVDAFVNSFQEMRASGRTA
jgi:Domain of unknown function (DUF4129)